MLSTSAQHPPPARPSHSKIHPKEPSFSREQKSLAGYQKSNSCDPLLEEEPQDEGRLSNWSIQQQNTLVALHNQKGNKWVQIALQLHKSDNEVKNRYHSKLRKGIRKINKLITDAALPAKPLKGNLISKVIQTAEDVYLQKDTPQRKAHPQAREAFCIMCDYPEIKNAVLDIAALPEEGLTTQETSFMQRTVLRIVSFYKNYRKKFRELTDKPAASCKYKGKQIKTLLKENQQTVFRNQLKNCEKSSKEGQYVSIDEALPSQSHQILMPMASPACQMQQTYFMFAQPCFPPFYLPCLPTYDAFSSATTFGSEMPLFGSNGSFSYQ